MDFPLVAWLVQLAQDLGKAFWHPSAIDFGILPAKLTADCRHDVGSERGRWFALVLIAHLAAFRRVDLPTLGDASTGNDARLTPYAGSRGEDNAIHRANNQSQESNDQRAKGDSSLHLSGRRVTHAVRETPGIGAAPGQREHCKPNKGLPTEANG